MALSLVFFLIALVCGFIVVYPYLIYPLTLRLLPKRPYDHSRLEKNETLSVSILFCAFNEEQALPAKLDNLRSIKKKFPGVDVLAYSDASTDATNELLLSATDVLTPTISEIRRGKVAGMRKLVSLAKSDILIFSDANVLIDPNQLGNLLEYFKHHEIDCVSSTLIYDKDPASVTHTAHVGGLYWRLEEYIKKLESQTGSTMGADGALFARRRSGYPILADHMVDDMAASMSVLFTGGRCVSAPDVIATEKPTTNSKDEFRRKKRIACGAVATYYHLLPQIKQLGKIDRFKFFSHKTLRWWGASFMLLGLISLQLSGIFLGIGWYAFAGQVAAIATIYTLGSLGLPIFGSLLEIIRAVIATNIGVLEYYFGKAYSTWTPPKSSREEI